MLSLDEKDGRLTGAVGDYAGNAGSHLHLADSQWALFTDPVDGVFNSGYSRDNPVSGGKLTEPIKGRYGFQSLTDGSSNTTFVAEKFVNSERLGIRAETVTEAFTMATNPAPLCGWAALA